MDILRVAIIGQGRSGRDIHGSCLIKRPDEYKIVFVAETIPARRERAAAEYGCYAAEDYRELFGREDVDLVVNAAPSHLHAEITADMLRHGFNVLCEKPFARTVADVDMMIAEAEKNKRVLAVFQQSRFAPYFRKLREVLDSGVLGRTVQISIRFNGYSRRWDWQCCREFTGGNLYNTGPHPLDQALTLLDYDGMPNVLCKMDRANTFGDAEDYVKLILTAPNRPLIDLEISSCDAYSPFTYHVMGTQGGLKGGMNKIEWKYFMPEEAPSRTLIKESLGDAENKPMYCEETLKWYEKGWEVEDMGAFTTAVFSLYDSVRDAIKTGAPLPVSLQQVRRQIEVIEECHRQNPL